jgi:hypothetical protein
MALEILMNQVFASSPAFVRQEIMDENYDAQKLDLRSRELNRTPINDIVRVTYVSDGKTLNVTIWLNSNLTDSQGKIISLGTEKSHLHRYGIYIDADSDVRTGANGIDYVAARQWNPSNNKWTETFSELTSHFDQRDFYYYNHTDLFDDSRFILGKYISFTVDLETLNFPGRYKITAFALDPMKNFIDLTHWIPIPPPEITVSASDVYVVQGMESPMDVQIDSTKGYEPKVILYIPKQGGISGQSAEIQIPTYGTTTSHILIKSEQSTKVGSHTLTMLANASFPLETSSGPYFLDRGANNGSIPVTRPIAVENMIVPSRAAVTVQSLPEHFLAIINPFSAIYQAMAPIATAVVSGITAIITWRVTKRLQEKKKHGKRNST